MSAQQPLAEASLEAGLRQSALLLHAMQHGDRQWVLERLPADERNQVAPLLEELEALGIPRNRDLLQTAITQSAAPVESTAPSDSPESEAAFMLRSLDSIPPHERAPAWTRLCAVLKEEPAGLIAQMLQLHDWSWKESALKAITPRKRARVLDLTGQLAQQRQGASDVPHAVDLQAALLGALFERVLQADPAPAESVAHHGAQPVASRRTWWHKPWRAASRALRSAQGSAQP